MTWFWGVQWSWSQTGWVVCFSAGPVAMAFFAQLVDPTPEWLSDESIAKFLSHHKWPDPWTEEGS